MLFENRDPQGPTFGQSLGYGIAGLAVGAIAGAVGSVYAAEAVMDHVKVLQQSPALVQYGIDAIALGAGALIGAPTGREAGLYAADLSAFLGK